MTSEERRLISEIADEWLAEGSRHNEAAMDLFDDEEEKAMHREAARIYEKCALYLIKALSP